MNEVIQTIKHHASVRRYTGEAIAPELLQQLIECGQAAASSNFIQAYSIIRVVDENKRTALAEAAGDQRWIIDAAEFLVYCADLRRVEYSCEQAGVGRLEGYTEHFIAATVDVALVAQNIMLAAESSGLGGVYIGGIRNNPQAVSDLLKLPELVYPVFGMCLGWPLKKPQLKPRFPQADILHEDCYKDNAVTAVDRYDRIMQAYYAGRDNNVKAANWSQQTAVGVQDKTREHMLGFLRNKRFLLR